ncbi:hypothetical protein C0Q70_12717 [Pomacea canaliculata]|uniref:Tachylectin 2 domain-containing protein n=1 Tax=Pomacea canaliculata TaxID=400727 RepID=A0A2T7P299_POMCA|nr:hypothetical protein C0Q70_12717 [Pomacea canaliculata]
MDASVTTFFSRLCLCGVPVVSKYFEVQVLGSEQRTKKTLQRKSSSRHASIVAFLLAVLALTECQAFTSVKLPRDEHWPYNYVSIGPAGVWAVNRQNKLFYRTGTYGDNANIGSGWQFKRDGVGQVDVGKDKVGFINLSGRSLFRIDGISQANPVGGSPYSWQCRITNWCYADGSYTETVTTGGSGTWITKSQLKYKSGTFGNPDTEGGDWITVDSGSFQHVSSGSGVVLAVRSNGELVQRTGITCSLPQGSGWSSMLNGMSRVDTYGTVAWAVDTYGDLYFINL